MSSLHRWGKHLHHPSKNFATVLKILQPLRRTFAGKKGKVGMDRWTSGRFSCIYHGGAYYKEVFFLEETRNLFLAFSPMAQEDSPKVWGWGGGIQCWLAGSDMTDIKKETVKILWHQHSLKISDQKISPTPTHLAKGKFLQNILYLLFRAGSVSPE